MEAARESGRESGGGMSKSKPWTADAVLAAVEKRFPPPAYVTLPQVRNGTGYSRRTTRTADAIVASVWPSRGLHFTGIEIKVSRSDWMREIADLGKAAEIQRFCHYWYVAAPAGLIQAAEVPETWGLIECDARGSRYTKEAPTLKASPPDMLFVCAVLRAAADAHAAHFHKAIPVAEVEKRIEEQIERRTDEKHRNLNRQVEQLRTTISEFEKASGVSLARAWDGGHIGWAVKVALECNGDSARSAVQCLQQHAKRVADQLERALNDISPSADDLNFQGLVA